MKNKLKLFGSILVVWFSMLACEKIEIEPEAEFGGLKKANNGMIKSYDNSMFLTWNEALSKAIDTL